MKTFLGTLLALAAGLSLASTSAVASSAPSTRPASVVTHYAHSDQHAIYNRATARAYLPGARRDFKAFAAHAGHLNRRWVITRHLDDCRESSGLHVAAIAYAGRLGYAIGDVSACGGYEALWTNVNRGGTRVTHWREVFGSQDGWYCPVLKRFRVPSALVGDSCYSPKAKRTLAYHQE
jgi:hypothetical protein